jgi:hypothetical protein
MAVGVFLWVFLRVCWGLARGRVGAPQSAVRVRGRLPPAGWVKTPLWPFLFSVVADCRRTGAPERR